MNEAPAPRADRLHTAAAGALLAAVVCLAYIPVRHAGFIWDDNLDFQIDRPVDWLHSLYRVWCTADLADYYPVTWTACLVQSHLFGNAPLGYHLVNLALHVVGVLLLWRVLRALRVAHSWTAALIFGVHPVTVASVAWACEIKNTLSFIFYALTVLFYLRWLETPTHRTAYNLALGSFLLALLSKTSGVCLPLFMLACQWWLHGRPRRRDAMALVPFFVLAAAMSLVSIWFQQHRAIGDDVLGGDPFLARLACAGHIFWFYVRQSLCPTRLMMIYPDLGCDARAPAAWLPDILLGATLTIAVGKRRSPWGRSLLFALLYVGLMLLPVLGFIDMAYMRFSAVADQFSYLALCGLVALYVATVDGAMRRLSPLRTVLAPAVTVLAVGLLGTLTWRQASLYRDAEIFWKDNVRKNPQAWCAWTNIAQDLANRGLFAAAIPYYDRQLRIRNFDEKAWYDRGVALMGCGRLDEAVVDFKRALRLNPHYARAHNNLAVVLQKLHKDGEALRQLRLAVADDTALVEACDNLANMLVRSGQLGEAQALYVHAVTVDPQYADGWCNLGAFFADRGHSQEALVFYKKALAIRPDFPQVYNNLGVVYSRLGRTADAVAAFKTLCRLRPNDALGYHAVGSTEAAAGHFESAIVWFSRATEVDPAYASAWNNLALLYSTAPNPRVRDGARAMAAARRACELTKWRSAETLHTLGAAYAEAGRFADAVRADEKALSIAVSNGDARLQASIRACLALLRAGKTCR